MILSEKHVLSDQQAEIAAVYNDAELDPVTFSRPTFLVRRYGEALAPCKSRARMLISRSQGERVEMIVACLVAPRHLLVAHPSLRGLVASSGLVPACAVLSRLASLCCWSDDCSRGSRALPSHRLLSRGATSCLLCEARRR